MPKPSTQSSQSNKTRNAAAHSTRKSTYASKSRPAQGGKGPRSARKPAHSAHAASPARHFALEIGREVRERSAFTHDLITARSADAQLSPEDKAFATKLALGVTMTCGMLDTLIDRYVKKPSDLEPEVRDALRISVYEIIYLQKSPHAAVDQGVELVRHVKPKAAGLANAVLRKIVRSSKDFPFGDPSVSLQALAREQAFPFWLTKRLVKDRGYEAAREAMIASNEAAPLYIAINCAMVAPDDLVAALKRAGEPMNPVTYHDVVIKNCYQITQPRLLAEPSFSALFERLAIYASDASAQYIAQAALPDTLPQRFLEIGSGRGTKTLLLQNAALERYGTQMHLEAVDTHAYKMKLLAERAQKAGIRLDKGHVLDARHLEEHLQAEAYDAVLVDAPCSGLGTLRRHPEIRWRLAESDIASLAQLSFEMLSSAAHCVAPGGLLTYATCTVTKEENEQLVESFLSSDLGQQFEQVPFADGSLYYANELVSGGPDAHFAVRLRRRSASVVAHQPDVQLSHDTQEA